jgi:Protein of unknown function (DUF3617)
MRLVFVRSAMVLIGALMSAMPSLTAAQLQPGLWEVTGKIQGGNNPVAQIQAQNQKMTDEQRKAAGSAQSILSPEMQAKIQAQMASMAPEQRKAMQAAMDVMKNSSVASDGTSTFKMCFTKEMIAKQSVFGQNGKCLHKPEPLVGNTQKFTFTCTDPTSVGEGSITFQSSTAYSGSLKLSSLQNGKSELMVINNTGKFINANCGDVKPMPMTVPN